jgi:hypothetical protein
MLYFLYMKYVVLSNFYYSNDILELLGGVMLATLQVIVGIVLIPFDILLSPIELITFFVWKKRRNK